MDLCICVQTYECILLDNFFIEIVSYESFMETHILKMALLV